MDTSKLAPKQIWQAKDGSRARVLRVFSDLGRTGSLTSMMGCQQVRYFSMKSGRQVTARAETFLANFPVLTEE